MYEQGIYIQNLTMHHFRGYQQLSFSLPSKTSRIFLYGNNGAGKTSLLEAISLFSSGNGLKKSKKEDFFYQGQQNPFYIQIHFQDNLATHTLELKNSYEHHKKIFLNRNPLHPLSEISHHFPLLWMTPETPSLFKTSRDSRKFFEHFIATTFPYYGYHLSLYKKLIKERIQILQNSCLDETWLTIHERKISAHAIALCVTRLMFLEKFSHFCARLPSVFPQAKILLKGELEEYLIEHCASETENFYCSLLKDSRSHDKYSQYTHHGPHKSRFSIIFQQKNTPFHLSSSGEQKNIILGLIIAFGYFQKSLGNIAPILLLDDLTIQLDAAHLQTIKEILRIWPSQIWSCAPQLDTTLSPDFFPVHIHEHQIFNA